MEKTALFAETPSGRLASVFLRSVFLASWRLALNPEPKQCMQFSLLPAQEHGLGINRRLNRYELESKESFPALMRRRATPSTAASQPPRSGFARHR